MLMFGCSVQTLVQRLCMIYKMCHWPPADATKLSDAESQPFLSSWCHNLSSRPPPKAGSGREKSVTVQGFPLQSCTLIHLFQTSRREEAAEGQTSIITEEKTSPEWHRGPAAETWSGQTWKESLRGRGGGGAKAKVSRAAVIVELYVGNRWWCRQLFVAVFSELGSFYSTDEILTQALFCFAVRVAALHYITYSECI